MPNEYVNKVEFGNETVMDITDTTAETGDVLEGEVFYAKSGARSVGTLGDATQSAHGLMSAEDKTKLDSLSSYSVMTGATSSTAGASGLVPAPSAGDNSKFLRGDGSWADAGGIVYGNTIDMSSTDTTKVSEAIADKAPVIIANTDKAFNHDELSNVNKITFHGNEYAFRTCRYANEKNLVQTDDKTYTTVGVEVQCVNHFIIINGTGTSTSNTNALDKAGDTIPAGNYVAYININANGTVIAIAKTFEIVAYYTDDTTETFSKSADVDDITIAMTFAKDVKKLRIRPGIRQDVVYTDYTFWVGVYSEDVVIADTNLTVQDEATVDYVAQISDTVIDTMQHESVVSEIQNTKEYVDKKADKADTVLETTLSRGRKANTAVGTGSFAFGSDVNASGNYSHAEGYNTSATGSYSHAEGGGTVAKVYSHAEGYVAKATGDCSHAEGSYTTAQRKSQHVGGEYNVPDTAGTEHTRGDYVEIIGNGTSTASLSNARVLDWNGNERLAGDLYVNCNDDSTGGTKVIATAFTGSTGISSGTMGLVPAPQYSWDYKFLRNDGTWAQNKVYYASCSTAADTSVKVLSNIDSALDSIQDGIILAVRFTYGNTADNVKLSISTSSISSSKYVLTSRYYNDVTWGYNDVVFFAYNSTAIVDIQNTGAWRMISEPVMLGSTSSSNGAAGLVPAPSSGDQEKFLRGDGTWATAGGSSGSGLYTVTLDTVTQATTGTYTHTTTVSDITSDLKAVNIECSNPLIFLAPINITTSSGSVTLSCTNVAAGTSTVKVSFLVAGNFNPLASMEYNALDARVGDLSDLTTTDKTDIVSAINEANSRDFALLTPSAPFSVPAVGTPVLYDMEGITENHELIRWNFSQSSENAPPASLTWETYNGYFMITNLAGTTDETMRPVFALTTPVTITPHIEEEE